MKWSMFASKIVLAEGGGGGGVDGLIVIGNSTVSFTLRNLLIHIPDEGTFNLFPINPIVETLTDKH